MIDELTLRQWPPFRDDPSLALVVLQMLTNPALPDLLILRFSQVLLLVNFQAEPQLLSSLSTTNYTLCAPHLLNTTLILLTDGGQALEYSLHDASAPALLKTVDLGAHDFAFSGAIYSASSAETQSVYVLARARDSPGRLVLIRLLAAVPYLRCVHSVLVVQDGLEESNQTVSLAVSVQFRGG